jgi:hypothetical protein
VPKERFETACPPAFADVLVVLLKLSHRSLHSAISCGQSWLLLHELLHASGCRRVEQKEVRAAFLFPVPRSARGLWVDEALILSLSSFHGRGFFSQSFTLGDTYARLAAAEAVVGLLIEICVIATFTQRFLGK